jgi:hypothetical protein
VIDRNQVHEGMVVRGSDGKKLGRVLSCTEGSFVVEKGFFFVTDYAARYDDVVEISGDTIQLSRPREELAHGERALPREGDLGASITSGMGDDVATSRASARAEEEEAQTRGGVRGDENEPGPKYMMGDERGVLWPSYGDEGGGGLL